MSREVVITAVNVGRRIGILDDDTVFTLTSYDIDGNETADEAEAVSAVGQLPDGEWIAAFPITNFKLARGQ